MRRSAISRASSSGRKRPGSSTISRASCSTASRLLSDDSRPASCHGSRPRRVRAEVTLNGIPSISSPTAANKNLSRSGRNGRKDPRDVIAEALERGQCKVPFLGHGYQLLASPGRRLPRSREKVDTVAPLHGACFMVLLPQTKTAILPGGACDAVSKASRDALIGPSAQYLRRG